MELREEYKTYSHSKLLREIILNAIQKGNLDAKLRRCKYQSIRWIEREEEYNKVSLALVFLEAEYNRRFLKLEYENEEL